MCHTAEMSFLFILNESMRKIEKMQRYDIFKKNLASQSGILWTHGRVSPQHSTCTHIFTPLRDFSPVPISKIPHLLPKQNHPKRLASTHAVAVHVATQRCVLWLTPGRWSLLCLASWESTEPSAGTTMLLEIW